MDAIRVKGRATGHVLNKAVYLAIGITMEGLKELLAPHFALAAEPCDIPSVLRETRRKFQHTLSEMTIWEKKA